MVQRLVLNYVVDLPFGAGKVSRESLGRSRQAGIRLGLDGVSTAQRGFPLFITDSQNLATDFAGTSRPNENGQNPTVSGSATSLLGEWFNAADFSQPPALTFGNIGRTLANVRAQGIGDLDFGLFKNTTSWAERQTGDAVPYRDLRINAVIFERGHGMDWISRGERL